MVHNLGCPRHSLGKLQKVLTSGYHSPKSEFTALGCVPSVRRFTSFEVTLQLEVGLRTNDRGTLSDCPAVERA